MWYTIGRIVIGGVYMKITHYIIAMLFATVLTSSAPIDNVNVEVEEVIVSENIVGQQAITIEYRDIPLDKEFQEFVINQSEYMGVPEDVVFAVMEVESGFQHDIVSGTNDYGLMQINRINHAEMERLFGYDNMLDPHQNVVSGIYILSTLYNKYETDEQVLMAYNMGESKAKEYWSRGIMRTKYVDKVVNTIEAK